MNQILFISWERQRRTVELAKALQCELNIIEYSGLFRYLKSIAKTIEIVKNVKPDVLIVQNPSMVLSFISVIFLKQIFSLPVIVDRHSNFLLTEKKNDFFFELIFNFLSYITIRYANLTIITNDYLKNVVEVLGGVPFVLPDKIPTLVPRKQDGLSGKKNILVISTFASDEPINELLQTFGKDKMSSYSVYISGDSAKLGKHSFEIPPNTILTGFLPENEFVDLLFQVDVVMVLSKQEYTLLCGCYEAVSAGKPLITSDSLVLRQLFFGAIFVENYSDSIANGVDRIFTDLSYYKSKSMEMKKIITQEWNDRFANLRRIIDRLKKS